MFQSMDALGCFGLQWRFGETWLAFGWRLPQLLIGLGLTKL
jgi:hypothetical protein